jgi:hypothetical protein
MECLNLVCTSATYQRPPEVSLPSTCQGPDRLKTNSHSVVELHPSITIVRLLDTAVNTQTHEFHMSKITDAKQNARIIAGHLLKDSRSIPVVNLVTSDAVSPYRDDWIVTFDAGFVQW